MKRNMKHNRRQLLVRLVPRKEHCHSHAACKKHQSPSEPISPHMMHRSMRSQPTNLKRLVHLLVLAVQHQ